MTKMLLSVLVGFVFSGLSNELFAQTTASLDWQFSLPASESITKARGLAVAADKGCPENDWQFSLPPAPDAPMDYAAAYQAVIDSADKKKFCLLTVGATKDQIRIAKELAKEKGYLFSALGDLESVPAGLYVLSRTSAGKGVLVAYPTLSKPVAVVPAVAPTCVECNNGKCVVVER